MAYNRCILIVLDSVGIGAAPDASRFQDSQAHTLQHIGDWCQKNHAAFSLPNLSRWGIGNLVSSYGIYQPPDFRASTPTLRELSPGKDTTTGHWEMAGTVLNYEFPVFENGFDSDLLNKWVADNKLPGWLGNKAASGTTILDELGEEHIRSGKPIVYTSGDSVFQIACSEETFGLRRLYDISVSARKLLDPLGVGRIIARPFLGKKPGEFKRTENRRDFSLPPPSPNILDVLRSRNMFVAGVGKIEDIFAHRSVNIVEHTGRNETSLESTLAVMKSTAGQRGLIFTNLIDFDQLHGHRRNPLTYAKALMDFDNFLPSLEAHTSEDDLLILTADHGNDPTHPGTDHTRENVPLLFWSPRKDFQPRAFSTLKGFTTIARLIIDSLGLQKELGKLPDCEKASSILNEGIL